MVSDAVDGRLVYWGLLGLVVVERLAELRVSSRNTRRLLHRGAYEVGQGHYPSMVVMHSLFLLACVLEPLVLHRPFIPWLAASMLLLVGLTMAVRGWVISTLGERWTTRVLCLPGEPLVTAGPFRWLRHPNYAAVIVELIAIPLVHTAWLTALIFTCANGAVLWVRIRVENAALHTIAGPVVEPGR